MKKLSSRFSIAVHVLCLIHLSPALCTGDFIAASVKTNPVIIRNIIAQLKKAGLVDVRPGVGGTFLLKDLGEISLLDVYHAVEVIDNGELFNVHAEPDTNCPIGKNMVAVLRSEMRAAQSAMEQRLAQVSLRQLVIELGERNDA
ncbi:Rrf2 family transcriptional regulator [Paenibacillus elgii]|uniref:Rrf2 family transcriptional regulator n=1 Tax=Paenibacillus elgii TaxID=189691 RepID=UPI000FD9D305|nr:Rrf2 family transcriptional regulator [Paenibacillus elgii]NEN86097.1 Rrf2 family transcriptional regulator [Paenibacillus elgii]